MTEFQQQEKQRNRFLFPCIKVSKLLFLFFAFIFLTFLADKFRLDANSNRFRFSIIRNHYCSIESAKKRKKEITAKERATRTYFRRFFKQHNIEIFPNRVNFRLESNEKT